MFDRFCDYMYYLLTSPFKKIKKSKNQWFILFKVLGHRFDEALESIYNARNQTMVATCAQEMLQIHAEDRGITRYKGEELENFRKRISNYTEVCRLGGTNKGVILSVWALGYNKVSLVPAKEFTSDPSRWAEFFIVITIESEETNPVGLDILKKEVRRTKEVGAKDNYFFIYPIKLKTSHNVSTKLAKVKYYFVIYYYDYVKLDGKWKMDGSIKLNNRIKNDIVMQHYKFTIQSTNSIGIKMNTEVIE